MVLSKPIRGEAVGLPRGDVYLSVATVAMGWISAVGAIQNASRAAAIGHGRSVKGITLYLTRGSYTVTGNSSWTSS